MICADAMHLPYGDESVDAIVTDPPYGLEFMGKEWDKLGGAGMSKPGIGERPTQWVSFGGADFGGANPTCATCGGRLRGKKKCGCDSPDWRVKGERVERATVSAGLEMQAWHHAWTTEALRVAKPGAHLLAFGGTRTHHRLMCAIEDAGWEIRDCIFWVYGSGFPKSLDVSKAIDREAGAEREVVGQRRVSRDLARNGQTGDMAISAGPVQSTDIPVTAPATEAAKRWEGWGTALKPAFEPIILARKPLEGTVAANTLKHGVGGINVDGCRVGNEQVFQHGRSSGANRSMAGNNYAEERGRSWTGRWPANLVLGYNDDEFELRDDVTPDQLRQLAEWIDENPE